MLTTTPTELAPLLDTLPPHSPETEMALLGSLILAGTQNIHILADVIGILRGPTDFYEPRHVAIYEVLVDLYDKHQSIDTIQMTQSLRDHGYFDQVGGIDYLVELAESVPTSVNAPHYARIVREKADRRAMIDAGMEMIHDAHHSTEPATAILDMHEAKVLAIAGDNSMSQCQSAAEVMHDWWEIIQSRERGEAITGLKTGFQLLDEMLSGLQNGELIILAARPSMGKTALALNIAEYISMNSYSQKQPVAIFSLEMGKLQLGERLVSSRSGVHGHRIRRNMINPDEYEKIKNAADEIAKAPLYIDDSPMMTPLMLRSKARRLHAQKGIRLLLVDYLQLMHSPGKDNRQTEVAEISRQIKGIARELNIPVVCLSQLNRSPELRTDKRPMLSDLRESGAIEQDADVVMMLHREEYYHQDEKWIHDNPDDIGKAELIIAKQRNGPTGMVPLQWKKETMEFRNPTYV